MLILQSRKRNDTDVTETDTQLLSTTVSTKSVFQVLLWTFYCLSEFCFVLVRNQRVRVLVGFSLSRSNSIGILQWIWGSFPYFIETHLQWFKLTRRFKMIQNTFTVRCLNAIKSVLVYGALYFIPLNINRILTLSRWFW